MEYQHHASVSYLAYDQFIFCLSKLQIEMETTVTWFPVSVCELPRNSTQATTMHIYMLVTRIYTTFSK